MRAQVRLSEDDGAAAGWERRGGKGEGREQQVGQPMQIRSEQRANQGGRQPLQRSGLLPLVTGSGDGRKGGRKERRGRETEWWRERG